MTIKVYSGRTGSGKSYNSIANVIIPSIKAGRTVVTNVVLKKAEIYKDYPDANIITIPFGITYKEAEVYIRSDRYPAGSVFVLDEGARLFPTGLKVTQVPSSVITFFTEHRHSVGFEGKTSEIFILAQDISQLAKFVRDLVDSTYHHTKLDKIGLEKIFRCDIYDGAIVRGEPIKSLRGSYSKDIYKYYESYTQKVDDQDSALEENPDNRSKNTGVYTKIALSALGALAACYFAYSSLTGFLGGDKNQDEQLEQPSPISSSQAVAVDTSTPSITSPLNQRSDPRIKPSDDWRLAGVIMSSHPVAIIESEDRSRFINLIRSCQYDDDIREWYCLLNGELVASYTGPVWSPEDDSNVIPNFD
ncbi:zonular occludens toxin domain-containing protein [Thalassolituus oleivorans]|uniref:zonular occludens toxin domain-containing protein n=1 Tax=Thalassolituus oleivorans TaxID=187493 RepID=UPI0023F1A988|nr:zonular occludens toxin domain-containing protein [Thalassolituus oleivorans]